MKLNFIRITIARNKIRTVWWKALCCWERAGPLGPLYAAVCTDVSDGDVLRGVWLAGEGQCLFADVDIAAVACIY